MQHLKDLAATVGTTKQISELLRVSPQHLAALEKAGTIKRLGKNQWPLCATVQGYLKSVQESRRHDNSEALRRVREAQLRKLEMANMEKARELIPYDEAEYFADALTGLVRTELDALPLRATRELRDQKRLQEEIDGVLHRIADGLRAQADALRTGEQK